MNIGLVGSILAFLPALIANPLAVIFGGGAPIDGGLKVNGKRLLGDGKTWRGLIGGGLVGGVVVMVFNFLVSPFIDMYPDSNIMYIIIFSLSFGALLGDITASFFKRRLGKKRGAKTPIIDQFDFVVGAILLTLLVDHRWIIETYFSGDGWIALIILIIGVPLMHRIVNIIGYKLGLKKEPW
ncbi:MAG: CDP-2,3-bis-(O-geranylgeranyl)-sn-glycerol synthase [Candidatus Saliniplasma sp.]